MNYQQRQKVKLLKCLNAGLEPTMSNLHKFDRRPNEYADAGSKAKEHGHFLFASRMFELAVGVTIGHGRAEWYQQASDICRQLHMDKQA